MTLFQLSYHKSHECIGLVTNQKKTFYKEEPFVFVPLLSPYVCTWSIRRMLFIHYQHFNHSEIQLGINHYY